MGAPGEDVSPPPKAKEVERNNGSSSGFRKLLFMAAAVIVVLALALGLGLGLGLKHHNSSS